MTLEEQEQRASQMSQLREELLQRIQEVETTLRDEFRLSNTQHSAKQELGNADPTTITIASESPAWEDLETQKVDGKGELKKEEEAGEDDATYQLQESVWDTIL